MILKPYSFNATTLQSTDFVADFPRSNAQLQAISNPAYVKRAGAVPVFSGKDIQPVVLNLEINMQHDFMTLFESINTLFDTKDETPRQFICTDEEDSSRQYYVYATAKQVLGGHDGPMATVALALDDPIWQAVTQSSQTFSTTASTSSTDIATIGNDYAFPVIEITPSTQATQGYNNALYLQILPQSSYAWANRFLDITGSTDTTFDTAALVSGGKMQADGDDLRVFRDGVEVDRWLNGINTTDTHVIVSCDMPAASNMTLKTAIASTDTVTEIELNYTTANVTVISRLPNAGRLIIDTSLGSTDSEEFTYTAKTVTDTKLAFTVSTRAVRNSLAVNHAANDPVRWMPYDFTIVYGNSSATAPVTNDARKPIVALTSRNNSFSYTNFFGYVNNQLRPNSFVKGWGRVANLCRYFSSTNDAGDTDPATALGITARTYQSGNIWRGDGLDGNWIGYFYDGISSISATGEQLQTVAAIPTTTMRAAILNNDVIDGYDLWTVSAQTSSDYNTWTTWTKSSSDAVLPSNATQLWFNMSGAISGDTDYVNKVALNTLTVGLTNYPHVMLRDEVITNIQIDMTITNDTLGESIRIRYPMRTSDTLYVDCDPDFPTVKFNGQMVNGAIQISSIRAAWFRLAPGSNTISYQTNNAAANDISMIFRWRERANFF